MAATRGGTVRCPTNRAKISRFASVVAVATSGGGVLRMIGNRCPAPSVHAFAVRATDITERCLVPSQRILARRRLHKVAHAGMVHRDECRAGGRTRIAAAGSETVEFVDAVGYTRNVEDSMVRKQNNSQTRLSRTGGAAVAGGVFGGMPGMASAAMEWNLQTPVTPIAQQMFDLHSYIFWICVVIFIAVFGVMFYSIFRHRKSVGHKAAQFHEKIGRAHV